MSVSMWSYRPEVCDGEGCPGDCDLCDKPKNMEDEDDTTDYISRQALLRRIAPTEKHSLTASHWAEVYSEIVKGFPSADVVEVVRCKDCVMCVEDMGNMFCGYQSFLSNPAGVSANDYCSKGERQVAGKLKNSEDSTLSTR